MDINKEREAFEAWVVENLAEGRSMSWEDWCWKAWQAAKAQAVPEGFVLVPEGFVLVPEGLTHEQAARISDDENFFETYQTILTESDTSEDSAVILIQTAHKAMIKAQEPAND